MKPDWFGVLYPSLADLESLAERLDCPVLYSPLWPKPVTVFHPVDGRPWCIGCPEQFGIMARKRGIAHELGHIDLGHDPVDRDEEFFEHEADMWAAQAMIPEAEILRHRRPTISGIMAAIRKHHQDWSQDEGLRRLAARIAYDRIKCLPEMLAG